MIFVENKKKKDAVVDNSIAVDKIDKNRKLYIIKALFKNIISFIFCLSNKELSGKEIVKRILHAYIIAICIKTFFYENYKIPSGSMNPTLLNGDRILVSKFYYGYSKFSFPFSYLIPIKQRVLSNRKPKYGDIVVFKLPQQEMQDIYYIKRIMGLPGDKIKVEGGNVIVNNKKLDYDFIRTSEPKMLGNENMFEVQEYIEKNTIQKAYSILVGSKDSDINNTKTYTVPEGYYFMMGDNRDNSKDSRFDMEFGFVPFKFIIGRAEVIFFSSSNGSIKYERIFKSLIPKEEQ
jgi:signal peptidase I